MKNIITGIIVLFSLTSFGQQIQKEFIKTEVDKSESKKFRNNFFVQRGISFVSEFYNLYPKIDTNYAFNNTTNSLEADSFFITRGVMIGVFTYTMDLRYNLLNVRDMFSVSLSSPLSAGFYIGGHGSNSNAALAVKLPLSVDFNFYLHSTYNNINKVGFYVGAGTHTIKAFSSGIDQLTSHNFMRIGLKYPYRTRFAYLELMVGKSNKTDFETDQGTLTDNGGAYFKITLGKLLKL